MSTETVELDFSDVKDFAPIAKGIPEGNYVLQVKKIELKDSKKGNPMWVVDSAFTAGKYEGQQIREYLTLTTDALFKVKSWLEALGLNIGKKKVKLPNSTASLQKNFGGKTFGAHIADGDPWTNEEGVTSVKSEVKFHMKASEVKALAAAPSAAEVTASTPEPDLTPETPVEEPEALAPNEEAAQGGGTAEPVDPEEKGDTADQLESFDLDDL